MCGRYSFKGADDLDRGGIIPFHYHKTLAAQDFGPRHNFAPTLAGPVFSAERTEQGGLEFTLDLLKWGFTPIWLKAADRPPPANARGETVATNGMFRQAFAHHRGLALASGFFEWQPLGKAKLPWRFLLRDGSPFGIGSIIGVWNSGESDSMPQRNYCLITTEANAVVGQIHDRMPVIIPRDHWKDWLDPATPLDEARNLIRPLDAALMTSHRVTVEMNRSAFEDPRAIDPIAEDMLRL